jgi:DinB superfamily
MSEQGDEIARECTSAVRASIEFCESCPDEVWTAVTPEEGWPVAAVLRHIAEAGRVLIGFAQEMAAGGDVATTMSEIDAWNAAQRDVWSKTTRAEAIALLSEVGDLAARSVRGYSGAQLSGVHMFAIYGEPRTTARMAQGFALHALEHLESVRAAATAIRAVSTVQKQREEAL